MIDILASGPLTYRASVDDALLTLGWIEREDDAVEGVEGAVEELYRPDGRIKDDYYPTEWQILTMTLADTKAAIALGEVNLDSVTPEFRPELEARLRILRLHAARLERIRAERMAGKY